MSSLFDQKRAKKMKLNKLSILAALIGSAAIYNNVNAADAFVKDGVVYEQAGQEMTRFGVNYNTPFAFGYRAIKAKGLDHKKAIDMDVDHIARLGLDAYRVHIWDREISDQDGNLVDNVHLELFDYLMMRLAEKGIKSIITPVAWWGNGYPEPDQPTDGFASQYDKSGMNSNPEAVAKTQKYLSQFYNHTNRYTGKKIATDENIIAFELFNEPKHLDAVAITAYVNALIKTSREAGVKKPLFYNTAEQGDWQEFAQNLCKSDIDGVAYQWYPTGLIKGTRVNTNVLFNVDEYHDPFAGIKECQNKAKMIYEFDAADVTRNVMYPAMARSFRERGFQWATQFAYDPGVLADSNAEYNTHYMNLMYTPKKAMGLMAAGYIFRSLPRGYQAKDYPLNNNFEDFSINYQSNLTVANLTEQFVYSNNTDTKPKAAKKLKLVAGVGDSPVVKYSGNGAYFLEKIEDGTWLLEVYPDVVKLDDPHRPGSLKRKVNQLVVAKHKMQIDLPNLKSTVYLTPITQADAAGQVHQASQTSTKVKADELMVQPGIYLVSNKKVSNKQIAAVDANYYLPQGVVASTTELWHQPTRQFNVGDNIQFSAELSSPEKVLSADLYIRYKEYRNFEHFPMELYGATATAKLPSSWTKPGLVEYAIAVTTDKGTVTFPGKSVGHPNEWDFVAQQDYWQSKLLPQHSMIELFNANTDFAAKIYPKEGRAKWDQALSDTGQTIALQLGMDNLSKEDGNWLVRLALPENNMLTGKKLNKHQHVLVKIRAHNKQEYVRIGLLNKDSLAYGTTMTVGDQWQYKLIPLASLQPVTTMLTKSYPMFMPAEREHVLPNSEWQQDDINAMQGIQIAFDVDKYSSAELNKWHGIEIEFIALYAK